MRKYSMGIDFGTLSGRAIIVDIATGEEMGVSVMEYRHGVMSDTLCDGTKLPADYALQHPADYLDTLHYIIKDSIQKSGIDPADIIGIGVDFTASTILPVTEDGTPLCFDDKFKNNPHAYVKLWKHHAAQKEADSINALAAETDASRLGRYGGTTSSEWLLPKVMQIAKEDKEIFHSTARFVEAGNWIVWHLTGNETHSLCMAGFKAMWSEYDGYPDREFLKKLDPALENIIGDKISASVTKMSRTAGCITPQIAAITGLAAGTPVAPAFIDAHAALPALGITEAGDLLMIIGTSSCHILLGDKPGNLPGISGCVKDGIIDGVYAYEAGQVCVGDSFDWFVKNCVPKAYCDQAEKLGIGIHDLLTQKAQKLSPGSEGILALDWWNGNRTPYVDGSLSGVIVGANINTLPEQIYRALIESTAYGTKRIVEIYEQNGIEIKKLYAAGGIAEKNALLMQIYADVLGKEIRLSGTNQACAYGSAVLGAAVGGGYATLTQAAESMKKISHITYKPDAAKTAIYNDLYEEYKTLSEYFAKGSSLMQKLKKLN